MATRIFAIKTGAKLKTTKAFKLLKTNKNISGIPAKEAVWFTLFPGGLTFYVSSPFFILLYAIIFP